MYFSDRESGSLPRINDDFDADMWRGLITLIDTLIRKDSFARSFPDNECRDLGVPTATNTTSLGYAIRAEIPELQWPENPEEIWEYIELFQPPTLAILDLIEFCHKNVVQTAKGHYHRNYKHYHLSFDEEAGRRDFRERVETILARNGASYELKASGRIIRLAPPIIRETLRSSIFKTADPHLDSLLESARAKYLNVNPGVRRESLEKLWDAWERLKTIELPDDKKRSIGILLDKGAPEANFRERLEREAKELTEIGNAFMIRHTEANKTPIDSDVQVDYLFQRLFSLILLLLRSR